MSFLQLQVYNCVTESSWGTSNHCLKLVQTKTWMDLGVVLKSGKATKFFSIINIESLKPLLCLVSPGSSLQCHKCWKIPTCTSGQDICIATSMSNVILKGIFHCFLIFKLKNKSLLAFSNVLMTLMVFELV